MSEPIEMTGGISASTCTWLTVSEAATALKVSERTIQRRAQSGKIAARRVTDESGVSWLIDSSAIGAADTSARGAAIPTDRVPPKLPTGAAIAFESASDGDAISADKLPTGAATVPPSLPPSSDKVTPPQSDASTWTALIAEKDERIQDLREVVSSQRLQIEAHARAEAELRAALREALKMSNRALVEGATPSGEPTGKLDGVGRDSAEQMGQNGTGIALDLQVLAEAQKSREDATESPQIIETGKVSSDDVNGPRIESAAQIQAAMFERSKGFRAWLLRLLRG